jgi:hypothetical protein
VQSNTGLLIQEKEMSSKPENYIVWYWQENFGHSSATIEANDALEAAQSLKDSIVEKYGKELNSGLLGLTPRNINLTRSPVSAIISIQSNTGLLIQEKDMNFIEMECLVNKYESALSELVQLLTPHIKKIIVAELTSDDQVIRDMIKAEVSEAFDKYDLDSAIESAIGDYDFDHIIEQRCDELDLANEDRVKEIIDDHNSDNDFDSYQFRDAVKDVVRDMDISVGVN